MGTYLTTEFYWASWIVNPTIKAKGLTRQQLVAILRTVKQGANKTHSLELHLRKDVIMNNEQILAELKTLNTVEVEPYMVDAVFPKLNKCDWLDDYLTQFMNPNNLQHKKVQICHRIELTDEQFKVFTHSLLHNFDWLKDKGGSNSTYPLNVPEGASFMERVKAYRALSPEQKAQYNKMSYDVNCIVVANEDNGNAIIVNPEQHEYARYVGFFDKE